MITKFGIFENENGNLKDIDYLESLKPELAKVAQKEYDEWEQDENGYDEVFGGGGICQEIANKMCDVLISHGVESVTMSQHIGEQHVYVLAKIEDGVCEVDIPPYVYEEGGGYSWRKIPNITIAHNDVVVNIISPDPEEFEDYTGEDIYEKLNTKFKEWLNESNGESDDIRIDLENRDDEIVNILTDGLTFIVKKRKIRSLRIAEIEGFLNRQDTIYLEQSKINVQMTNSDTITGEFVVDFNKNKNVKISINGKLVFDLEHESYNLHTMVNKMVEQYKKFLHKNNWKLK